MLDAPAALLQNEHVLVVQVGPTAALQQELLTQPLNTATPGNCQIIASLNLY